MKNRILSVLLVLAMAVSFLPAIDLTAFAVDPSWNISAAGSAVTATLKENTGTPGTYTLALTGTGATKDYTLEGKPE